MNGPAHHEPTHTMRSALTCLVNPQSIAIVGASSQFGKVSGRPLKHLLEKGYRGKIWPINPRYTEMHGLTCYTSIAALPDAPDLAIVALPAQDVLATIRELGRRGTRSVVVFSSGFGEMGEAGKAMEAEMVAAAREYGMPLCGPNCLGFINAFENVYATFSQYADRETQSGPIAFVTQSGAFGTAIAALARQRGLGLGYFINTGNEADVGFADLMLTVIEDPRIKVAAGYLEGVRDGEALIRLAKRCQELGKPLVLTKVGRMAAGARAAASHTGSMAGEDAVFDAVIRQYGVIRARNEEQLLDMAQALAACPLPHGNGLGIATQSGGAGVMMADRAEEVGLAVPPVTDAIRKRLVDLLPAFGAAGNPVDVTGQFVGEPELLRESVLTLLDDPNIHVGIVWLQLMHAYVDVLVEILTETCRKATKPCLVCWVAAPEEAVRKLAAVGIPVFQAGERAVDAAAALVRHGEAQRRWQQRAPQAAHAVRTLPRLPDGVVPSVQGVSLLKDAGIPMAPVALATSEDHAVALWHKFGKGVALKIESTAITHKSDIGGVLLNLNDEAAIRTGYRSILANAARHCPDAKVDGVLVQPLASGHVELVVGVKRDPSFGMIVMVGSGGVLVEVMRDVAFRRAPFAEDEAARMLGELRMGALLDGVRGKPAVDRAQICNLLASLSRWAAEMEDQLEELDLNPVLVGPDGPVGVDCVMVIRHDASPAKR
ncbi:acetate--CoA ligase family protein [Imbroritus primus]